MNVTDLADRLMDRADELRMLADSLSAPYILPETKKTMCMAMLSGANEMEQAADELLDREAGLAALGLGVRA
jgi:hypothetical protein